ncbi:MAG: N-acetylmuramoyl-L-alanine amidase [Candidatus Roizmanbacteria bacterium]|nr:N-acetylmuramoyl-L-alanine amidase [Candidatus Roizmanbacteria bacterium]
MAQKNILIQFGHHNITNNCDPSFRGLTGAPDEQRHNREIGTKLATLLNENGFNASVTDANSNCPSNASVMAKDYDLFISLHCDSNYTGDQGGGFVDYPDPSVDDSNAESKRIKEAIEAEYFANSGIRNVPSRSNPNTKFYYAWSYASSKTPCVILEMGESIDPHDSVILNDITIPAKAILKGIQRAFSTIVTPQPPQPPQPSVCEIELANATRQIAELKQANGALQSDNDSKLAEIARLRQVVKDVITKLQAI